MSILDPLGIFGDGGGSSSASVSSAVTLSVTGLDKIGVTETIDVKPVEIKPLTVNENVEIRPLTINENIDLKPVAITETIDVRPVTLNENIDLKPLAVDSCQTLRLAPLPETKLCNPYHHHVAVSMFGVELMAMTFNGDSEQEIHSPHRPQVTERTWYPEGGGDSERTVLGDAQGIRVRILGHNDD